MMTQNNEGIPWMSSRPEVDPLMESLDDLEVLYSSYRRRTSLFEVGKDKRLRACSELCNSLLPDCLFVFFLFFVRTSREGGVV